MNSKQTTTQNVGSARVQKNGQKNIQNAVARVLAHKRASTSHRQYDETKKVYVINIVDKHGKVLDTVRVGKRSDARQIQKGIQATITQMRIAAGSKKQNAGTRSAGSKKNAKKASKK